MIPNPSHRSPARLTLALGLLLVWSMIGCESERDRSLAQGAHPIGWADESAVTFHGSYLRAEGYPLDECQGCHGQDYAGGVVDESCSSSGSCHAGGVEDCAGTCHGDMNGPRPKTGAHAAHAEYCDTCHPVPADLSGTHVDLEVDIVFAHLAIEDDRNPSYHPDTKTCTNTYCHVGDSPAWDSGTTLSCEGCHSQSPTHDRFSRVVDAATCAGCHAGSPEEGHIDGTLRISVATCNACHGVSTSTGAPPPALDGSTESSSLQVGAHRRHLDPNLSGRMGKVVACVRCHAVPAQVLDPGHIDSTLPADVDLILGDYEPATHSCVVDCHFARDPGPVWNNDSGSERACDACHGFPPVINRSGTRHPSSAPDLDLCLGCHLFSPSTHVDGEISFP